MPGVVDAAVVAVPDPTYGERAAAVLQMDPLSDPATLETIRRHCELSSLSRQKWPEYVIGSEALPRTSTGKLQKHLIRDYARKCLATDG